MVSMLYDKILLPDVDGLIVVDHESCERRKEIRDELSGLGVGVL